MTQPHPHEPLADTTGVPLQEYMLTLITEIEHRHRQVSEQTDLRYKERFEAQTRALDAAFSAQQVAARTALSVAETAVAKAEHAYEKRLDALTDVVAVEQQLSKVAERVEGLDRLTDAKFVTFRTLIDSQADKVALALAAADKAVIRSEIDNERRFAEFVKWRELLTSQVDASLTRAEVEARLLSLTEDCRQRISALRAVFDTALSSADKAVSKAEVSTEKRFESVNEFRAQLSDQTKGFVTRVEFDAQFNTTAERLRDVSQRLDRSEGKSTGLNAGWVYFLGVLAAIGTIVSLMIAFQQ